MGKLNFFSLGEFVLGSDTSVMTDRQRGQTRLPGNSGHRKVQPHWVGVTSNGLPQDNPLTKLPGLSSYRTQEGSVGVSGNTGLPSATQGLPGSSMAVVRTGSFMGSRATRGTWLLHPPVSCK